jgi:hypothetical protein
MDRTYIGLNSTTIPSFKIQQIPVNLMGTPDLLEISGINGAVFLFHFKRLMFALIENQSISITGY